MALDETVGQAVAPKKVRKPRGSLARRPVPPFDPQEMVVARTKLGMTQQQLADAFGMTKNGVSRIERGDAKVGHPALMRLALHGLALTHAAMARPIEVAE